MGCLKLTYHDSRDRIEPLQILYRDGRKLCIDAGLNHLRGLLFGFNGYERDNEIYGEGNAYNFGDRIQDSRLGRFLSMDRFRADYPWNSPYSFADNSPLRYIDLGGKNPALPIVYAIYEGVVVAIEIVGSYFVAKEIQKNMPTTLYNSHNPGYDWQRKQEKEAQAFNAAKAIAISKIIQNNFNNDPDDFKDPKNRWGKGALVVGALVLLEQVQSELKRMEEMTKADIKKEEGKIAKLRSKDQGTLTDAEKLALTRAEQKRNQLGEKLQGVVDAMEKTKDLIDQEKLNQAVGADQAIPQDNLQSPQRPIEKVEIAR